MNCYRTTRPFKNYSRWEERPRREVRPRRELRPRREVRPRPRP